MHELWPCRYRRTAAGGWCCLWLAAGQRYRAAELQASAATFYASSSLVRHHWVTRVPRDSARTQRPARTCRLRVHAVCTRCALLLAHCFLHCFLRMTGWKDTASVRTSASAPAEILCGAAQMLPAAGVGSRQATRESRVVGARAPKRPVAAINKPVPVVLGNHTRHVLRGWALSADWRRPGFRPDHEGCAAARQGMNRFPLGCEIWGVDG